MIRARKCPPHPKRPPAAEASIYDGARLLGNVLHRDGAFIAVTADGEELGTFKRDRDAMHAVCDAGRASRFAETTATTSDSALLDQEAEAV